MKNLGTLILLASIGLAGCMPKKQLLIDARFPAQNPAAAELKSIAVFDFTGDKNKRFKNELIAELKSAEYSGTPYFSVYNPEDSSTTRGRTKQQELALAYGRKVGVEGVYLGSFSDYRVESDRFYETRSKCAYRNEKEKCERYTEEKIPCTKQTAVMIVQPQLLSVKTAELVYSDTIKSTAHHSYCRGDAIPSERPDVGGFMGEIFKGLDTIVGVIGSSKGSAANSIYDVSIPSQGIEVSDREFYDQLLKESAIKIRQAVAPYTEKISVELKTKPDGISDQHKERFKGAVAFATENRMDRACGMWKEIALLSPESAESINLLFNQGVCAESVANYREALRLYNKADAKLSRPDEIIERARQRAIDMLNKQDTLKKMTS